MSRTINTYFYCPLIFGNSVITKRLLLLLLLCNCCIISSLTARGSLCLIGLEVDLNHRQAGRDHVISA